MLLAVVAAATTAACWGDGETPAPDVIAHAECEGDACVSEAALIEARLAVAHECVYLIPAGDDTRAMVPIFPPGTVWSMDKTVVILPDESMVAVGEWLRGSGGSGDSQADMPHTAGPEAIERVRTCVDAGDVEGRQVDTSYWDFQWNDDLVVIEAPAA